MSKLLRFTLWLLAAGIACVVMVRILGGDGTIADLRPIMLLPLVGALLLMPLSVILLLVCGVRQIVYFVRERHV